MIFASLAAGTLAEIFATLIFKGKSRIYDGNTVSLSLLFAALVPADVPSGAAAAAIFIGILLAKECFGSTGSQIFHPAFLGVVLLSFVYSPVYETKITVPAIFIAVIYAVLDPVTTPTSRQARLAFAVLAGALSIIFSEWQFPLLALSYAVLLSNAAVLVLDESFLPRGSKRTKKKPHWALDSRQAVELLLAFILISYIFFIGIEVWLPAEVQKIAAFFVLSLLAYAYSFIQKRGALFFIWLAAAGVFSYVKHPEILLDRFLTGAGIGVLYGIFLVLFASLKKRLLFCDIPSLLKGPKILVLTGLLLALSLTVFRHVLHF